MANKSTGSEFVTKQEAATILGVEEKSVTHVDSTRPDGSTLTLNQVPGL